MAAHTLKLADKILPAGEVGTFSVCPRAWKLKCVDKVRREGETKVESLKGIALHRTWSKRYDEAMRLTRHVRLVVALLCAAITIFLLVRSPKNVGWAWLTDNRSSELLELVPLVLLGLLVAEIVHRAAREQKEESGLGNSRGAVSIEGSLTNPVRDYVSHKSRLAGKPDAVITEGEFRIPVERKPLAKKLRDRYVAQLIVYMRLIEEFEGARPPYGYLVLGPQCRRVKVPNTVEKQRWVDSLVVEMREILGGADARPLPHPKKCGVCEVRHLCPEGEAMVQIKPRQTKSA